VLRLSLTTHLSDVSLLEISLLFSPIATEHPKLTSDYI
jgi:hypothetical protein